MTNLIENQSRLVRRPIKLEGVQATLSQGELTLKHSNGQMTLHVHPSLEVSLDEGSLTIQAKAGYDESKAMSGTLAALARNAVEGLTKGFEKKLFLKGVGYRAKLQGQTLVLTLGKSHEDEVKAPAGIQFTVPSATEIVVSGTNKQLVGQVAANICALRPTEPYKGKGISREGDRIIRKEVKKKST